MNKKIVAVMLVVNLLLSNMLCVLAEKQEMQVLNVWDDIVATDVVEATSTTSRYTTVEYYQSGGNKFAYVGFAKGDGSSSEALVVYDVTEPTNITEVARYTNIVTRIMNSQFVIVDDYLIVTNRQSDNYNKLLAYPINADGTLSNSYIEIASGGNGIDTVYAFDNYVFYALAGTNGRHVKVYDISNLSEGAVLLGTTDNNYGVLALEVEKISDNKYKLYYITRNGTAGYQLCINEMTVTNGTIAFNKRFHGTTGLENANALNEVKDLQIVGNEKVMMVLNVTNSGKYSQYIIDDSGDTVAISEISANKALSVVDINDDVYAIGDQSGNIYFINKDDDSRLHSIASGLGQIYDMDVADGKLFVAGESKFGVFDLYSYVSIEMDDIGEINDGILNIKAEIEAKDTYAIMLEIFDEEIDIKNDVINGELDYVKNITCPDGNYTAKISVIRGTETLLSEEKAFTVRKTMPIEITNSSLSVGTTSVTGTIRNTHNQVTDEGTAYLVVYNNDGSMKKSYMDPVDSLEKNEMDSISFTTDSAIVSGEIVKLFVVDNNGRVISDTVETEQQSFNNVIDKIPPIVTDSVNVFAEVDPDTVVAQISGKSADETENIVFINVYKPAPNNTQFDYINVFKTLSDGSFYCSYPLHGGVEGENYNVKVYTTSNRVLYGNKQFSYISQETIDAALDAVYNATAETFEDVAISDNSQYKNILNLNTSIYDTLIDNEENKYKLAVGAIISGTLYTDIGALNAAFDAAVNAQKEIMLADNRLKSAIAEINSSSSSDLPCKIEGTLAGEGYSTILELNLSGLYTKLDSVTKPNFYSKWIYNKNFTQKGDIQTAFREGVAIEYLKYAQYGSIVENNIIETYYSELGLSNSDVQEYLTLSIDDRKDMIAYYLDLDLTTYGNLSSKFNEALDDYDTNAPSNNGTTIITGGGGGGGGISMKSPVNEVPQIKEEDLIPQEILNIEKKNIFKDVKVDDWFFEAVCLLNEKKIVEGITVDEFKPEQNVKREEFAKMIICAFGLVDYKADSTFSDVESNRWYYAYVATAQKLQLINGIGNGKFGVGQDMTRQDLAKLVYDTMKVLRKPIEKTKNANFDDMNLVSDYAKEAVNALYSAKIMTGFGDNTFRPQDTVTRAMAAQVIYGIISGD